MRRTDRLSVLLAAERLGSKEPPLGVDVRTPRERASGYIAASVHVPLNHLAEQIADLPRDRPLLVHCAGGYRSSIAASLLQRLGFTDVSEIAGGTAAWEAAQLPLMTALPAQPTSRVE